MIEYRGLLILFFLEQEYVERERERESKIKRSTRIDWFNIGGCKVLALDVDVMSVTISSNAVTGDALK